jgi:hypothetical protein
MLYLTLVRSRLEYASIAWNTLISTDASKLECIQKKYLALCYNCFFSQVHYSYMNALDHLIFIPYALRGALRCTFSC